MQTGTIRDFARFINHGNHDDKNFRILYGEPPKYTPNVFPKLKVKEKVLSPPPYDSGHEDEFESPEIPNHGAKAKKGVNAKNTPANFNKRKGKKDDKAPALGNEVKPRQPKSPGVYVCGMKFYGGICGRIFKSDKLRREHTGIHADDRAKAAPTCWCVSTSPGWLSKHVREGCDSEFGRVPDNVDDYGWLRVYVSKTEKNAAKKNAKK